MFINFVKYTIIAIIITQCCSAEYTTVYVNHDDFKATVKGLQKLNINNETFHAFLGIPYAKAPIGELRFKDPQKVDPINGTFFALHEAHECCSITASNASEDCLYLNIYTKMINAPQLMPVLIVIHPGGLYLGSSKWLNPSNMMTKDIVLVTFNYRLGTMGFLNLGSPEYPGNAGLKDQVFALRWLNKHIAAFGGDPHEITLMGYSAGALSASLHLVSPMSKGLFHKAIIMSGSVPPQTMLPKGDQKFLAVRQAKRLNCSKLKDVEEFQWHNGSHRPDYKDIKNSEILDCLQQFKGPDITSTLRQMFDFGKDNPIYLWLPVVENDYGQERFLNEDFYSALKAVEKLDTPLLIGYTNGEFCTSSRDILTNHLLKSKFEKNFHDLAPRIFMYESQKNMQTISETIRNFYFNGTTTLASKDYDNLCDLFSDSIIRFGAHHLAEIISSKGLVFFYEFRHHENYRATDELFPNRKHRVEHMDDLQYLFNWSQKQNISAQEFKMVKLYTDFVYDFIKNGKLSNEKAKPYPHTFAVIDDDIRYVDGRNFENLQFWSNLLKYEDQLSHDVEL